MPRIRLAHGFRTSLRNNGQAYGFSVSITGGMALLNAEAPQSGGAHIMYFALGAASAFSLLEALASAGFRKPLEQEPSTVTALGISLSLVSVSTATGLAWAVAYWVGGVLAWPITGFVVSTAYPLMAGAELATAHWWREVSRRGNMRRERLEEEEGHEGDV